MNNFVMRFRDDPSRPTVSGALKDIAARAIAPAVVLWAAIVGIGFLLKGPFGWLASREELVNVRLAAGRTPTMDTITKVWSHIGNTEYVIGVCVIVVAVMWWRTKQWWYAVVPGLAIALQASVFVLATWLTDRSRPDVEHLDPAPPTSSYPSGHMGAATALYVTFALMAQRIENVVLRRVLTVVFLLVPLLVGYARLYRGMHHLIDVTVGALNGLACAWLAWHYLRRRDDGKTGNAASQAAAQSARRAA